MYTGINTFPLRNCHASLGLLSLQLKACARCPHSKNQITLLATIQHMKGGLHTKKIIFASGKAGALASLNQIAPKDTDP